MAVNEDVTARFAALEAEVERLRSLLAETVVLQTELIVATLRLVGHVEEITPRAISLSFRAREAHTRLRRLAKEASQLMGKLVPIEGKDPDGSDEPGQGLNNG